MRFSKIHLGCISSLSYLIFVTISIFDYLRFWKPKYLVYQWPIPFINNLQLGSQGWWGFFKGWGIGFLIVIFWGISLQLFLKSSGGKILLFRISILLIAFRGTPRISQFFPYSNWSEGDSWNSTRCPGKFSIARGFRVHGS